MDFSAVANMLAGQWGYVGILIVQLISSSTVLVPLPGMAVVFIYGAVLNPFLVGLFAAVGAAVGELTGYGIGYGGHVLITKRNKKWLKTTRTLLKKYNPFFVIIFLAAIPFPFDIVGLLCGLSHYDVKKFLVAAFVGNFIKLSVIALSGFYGISWVLKFFGG